MRYTDFPNLKVSEVMKIVEVEKDGESLRVELSQRTSGTNPYTARCFKRKETEETDTILWEEVAGFPGDDEKTLDDAMRLALAFIDLP